MDKRKEQEQVLRGQEAAQVLDNPAYKRAMELLKDSIVRDWAKTDVRDVEGQRLLLQFRKTAERFEQILSGMVRTGEFAERKLVDDQARNENRLQRVLRRAF